MSSYFFFLSAHFNFSEHGLFIIDFIVLVFILWYFTRKKVRKAMIERSKKLRESIEAAETEFSAANDALGKARKQMAELEQDRDKIIENFKKEGELERERIITEARLRAKKLHDDAAREVGLMKKDIEDNLMKDVVQQTVDGVVTRLNSELRATDHHRINRSFIKKLEKGDALDVLSR